MKYAVGIDIGGTNTRVALVNQEMKVVERVQFSTNFNSPEETMKEIHQVIISFDKEVVGIGISCPGPLDLKKGYVIQTPNLGKTWWKYPIVQELKDLIGVPVYLQNDANLATLAEATVGQGKDKQYVQFLTISTGVGSGLVIDKNIFDGAHGFAHEVANCILWKDGPKKDSLPAGSVEGICSGTAICNRAREAGMKVKHAGEVCDLAQGGHEIAGPIIDDAIEYLANFIATIQALIDPDIVILGGSVATKVEGFVEEVEKRVKNKVFDAVKPCVCIRKTNLNEDSGLLGAAYLAFSKANVKTSAD